MNGKKVLLVIDMQVDFVTGALENQEAQQITGGIREKIEKHLKDGGSVFFTRDTHGQNYMETQEGRMLPVPHCLKGSDGWQIVEELMDFATEENTFDKPSFGSMELPVWLKERLMGEPEEIEICGVCTDICVISNAMILKAAYPEIKITVDGSCCAGVTPESHQNALNAMAVCQMIIK